MTVLVMFRPYSICPNRFRF